MATLNHIDGGTFLIGPCQLPAVVAIPESPVGVIVFAHGSDSSRWSPRNHRLAIRLHAKRFATVLFDFLTESEAVDRGNSFKGDLLSVRLAEVLQWLGTRESLCDLPIGLLASGVGMTAVAKLSTIDHGRVFAIVSRGGRTDLVETDLARISAPLLLVVGENDTMVRQANRQAVSRVQGKAVVEVVSGASHLFCEPGKFDRVVEIVPDWFEEHLSISN